MRNGARGGKVTYRSLNRSYYSQSQVALIVKKKLQRESLVTSGLIT